eukprot:1161587-Pelagomonas_calceolata.AAC.16
MSEAGSPSLPSSAANSAQPFPCFLGGPTSGASTNTQQEGHLQEQQGSEQEEGIQSPPIHRLGSGSKGANHTVGHCPKDSFGAVSYQASSLYDPAPSAQQDKAMASTRASVYKERSSRMQLGCVEGRTPSTA